MARNKLLTEGEVRQFMKLADLGALSENYFSSPPIEEEEEFDAMSAELEGPEGVEDVEAVEVEDELPEEEGELSLSDDEALAIIDLAARLEAAMGGDVEGGDELEVDAELEGPEGDLEIEDEEEVVANMDGVYQEGGQSARDQSKSRSDYAHQDDKDPAEDEEEREKYDASHKGTGSREGDQSASRSDFAKRAKERQRSRRGGGMSIKGITSEDLNQDAVVAEVARRVAERLSANKHQDEMAAQLAERIFDRLTAK